MRELISEATVEIIQAVELALFHRYRDYPFESRFRREIKTTSSLHTVRARLILLNQVIAENDLRQGESSIELEGSTDWLFYEQEIDVVPIYQEAVVLVERLQILNPHQIQNFLSFMGIPKANTGVHPENHGNGYHFHYGKVMRDALVRYDVLLTFDKENIDKDGSIIPDIPLYVEPHSAGKCIHIDASTIGHNRRLPVYLVCDKLMRKRGIQNFMSPSNNSWQFYPIA